MTDVVIASAQEDAEAADRIVEHHAELAGQLTALVRTATRDGSDGVRDQLVTWARASLLPHAEAEERSLYVAAAELTELTVLVREMVDEHRVLRELVDTLERATTPGEIAAAAGALEAVLGIHLHKENEVVLPALVTSPDHAVAALLDGMHDLLGAAPADGHACACGHDDEAAPPELDARTIPHAIRHATIFGALDTVAPGHGLVLLAPHDPRPLLAQLERRAPGVFDIDYLERGPETWRLRFQRR